MIAAALVVVALAMTLYHGFTGKFPHWWIPVSFLCLGILALVYTGGR